MAFTVKTPEGIEAANKFLETNSFLSGGNSPGAEDRDVLVEIETSKIFLDSNTAPNLFGWWWTLGPFRDAARNLWGAEQKVEKKAKKDDKKGEKAEKKDEQKKEEEIDLFGDDPAAEEEAAKLAAKRKEEAGAKKKEKKPIIAKSEVIFEVKGYEADDDFEKIAAKVRTIEKEGLVWKDSHKIVPVGFGMNKLEMGMIIVDDLISTEDIFEVIEAWEEVQSVDVTKFTKA